jgi:hypothetical protein
MGLGSYSDELAIVEFTALAKEEFGHLPLPEPWESFYEKGISSEKMYPVKTHLPPRDNQPAIYIVRDGRAATDSYAAYHKSFQPNPIFCPTLLDLILGNDYYGSWSSHYHAWTSRANGRYLLLRYEQLVSADMPLLEKIASFIGYHGEISQFVNPFDKLHQEKPDFFRNGGPVWQRPDHWSEEQEALFLDLHGDVMQQLQYIDESERINAKGRLSPLLIELTHSIKKTFEERNYWLHEAEAKERVIKQLYLVAEERLSIIECLHANNSSNIPPHYFQANPDQLIDRGAPE